MAQAEVAQQVAKVKSDAQSAVAHIGAPLPESVNQNWEDKQQNIVTVEEHFHLYHY